MRKTNLYFTFGCRNFSFSKIRRTWSFHVVVLQRTAKKCTKIQNARAQPLFCSLRALSIRPKIPEIPGKERIERTFSGISFRNFRCTSRACPNIPENRNNRKILFHSTILLGPVSPRPKLSTWLPQCSNVPNPDVIVRSKHSQT